MKCPNCNGVMTCGCQKRKLPNGKIGCSKCANTPIEKVTENKDKTKKE